MAVQAAPFPTPQRDVLPRDDAAARLSTSTMSELVQRYLETSDARPWSPMRDVVWSELAPERLTAGQASAVRFVTCIEDHLPGYLAEYSRLFPLDATVSVDDFAHNRELHRFTVRWAKEEESHALALFLYQVRAGMAAPDELRRELAIEGRKEFSIGWRLPIQVFTYTLIQEKATQLYYQSLARVVTEPVLKSVLLGLAKDEARHFSFFALVVQRYLAQFGERLVPLIGDVARNFKMPLSTTLGNYWRWSLEVIDAADGFQHSEALEELLRVVNDVAEVKAGTTVSELSEFVRRLRGI